MEITSNAFFNPFIACCLSTQNFSFFSEQKLDCHKFCIRVVTGMGVAHYIIFQIIYTRRFKLFFIFADCSKSFVKNFNNACPLRCFICLIFTADVIGNNSALSVCGACKRDYSRLADTKSTTSTLSPPAQIFGTEVWHILINFYTSSQAKLNTCFFCYLRFRLDAYS